MFPFLAQRPGWDHMWGTPAEWGWGWMMFMMLLWVVLLVVLVWFAYRVAKTQGWLGDGPSAEGRRGRAEEILRERYARGELDRETFLRMLDDLRGGRAA